MHIFKFKKTSSLPPYVLDCGNGKFKDLTLLDSKGNSMICPVDEFSGQPFMRNENGFIMSDIQVFEESVSDSVARAALSRLQILHPDNAPVGTSVADLMRQVVPANFSTPAEYLKIQENFAKVWYSRQLAMQEKEQNIQSKESDASASSDESKS